MDIVDIYTKDAEKLVAEENTFKCKKCTLWIMTSRKGECRLPKGVECPAGMNKYFATVRLRGDRQVFCNRTVKLDKFNLRGKVWDWIDSKISEQVGKGYLKLCFELMDKNLGNQETWEETKDIILHLGPDNYQLETPRDTNDSIFKLWWELIKYEYGIRHPRVKNKKQ